MEYACFIGVSIICFQDWSTDSGSSISEESSVPSVGELARRAHHAHVKKLKKAVSVFQNCNCQIMGLF